jgi:hypothetical protein
LYLTDLSFLLSLSLSPSQPFSADQPIEELGPVEEDVRGRQAVACQPSKEDYYRRLSDPGRDYFHNNNKTNMESLKVIG